MTELFLKAVNASISASWLVLVVLVLRLLLKKAPRWVNPALWAIVAIRLVLPLSIESALSLVPAAQTVSPEIMYSQAPAIDSGVAALNDVVNPVITRAFTPKALSSANPLQIWIPIAAVIWLVGVAAMLIYILVSYLRLRHRVRTSVLLRGNIYQSEMVDSPFVFGLIKPRIYLPFQMDEKVQYYVIAHEQTHIKRRDHWMKPLGFIVLSVYWFNPLLWVAYFLLCRDIELACDARAVKTLDWTQRADYSQALLICSVPRKVKAVCPLAFGEVGVKKRVKDVLNYRKPALWVAGIALIVCVGVAVCFLTNPLDRPSDIPQSDCIQITSGFTGQSVQITDPAVIKKLSNDISELSFEKKGSSKDQSGWCYSIQWLDSKGRLLKEIDITEENGYQIRYNDTLYLVSADLNVDTDYIEELLFEAAQSSGQATDLDWAISAAILQQWSAQLAETLKFWGISDEENIHFVANHALLATEEGTTADGGRTVTAYVLGICYAYSEQGERITSEGGDCGVGAACALTFLVDANGAYTLETFWQPRDGAYYDMDVLDVFPEAVADEVINGNGLERIEALKDQCDAKALAYLQGTLTPLTHVSLADAGLKCDYASTEVLVKFRGAIYGRSFIVIDYAGGGEPIGTIDKLCSSQLLPLLDGETNTQSLLGAAVYPGGESSIILNNGWEYILFEKIL